jgi:hypothetical protein
VFIELIAEVLQGDSRLSSLHKLNHSLQLALRQKLFRLFEDGQQTVFNFVQVHLQGNGCALSYVSKSAALFWRTAALCSIL